MADDVSHEALRTVRATVERSGPVDRPRVAVPDADADALPTDDVVRLVLDGSTYHVRPQTTGDGVALTGAYDTPADARDPSSATDRLATWVAERDLDYGRTVHLDVVDEGFRYGLRAPGETAVYEDHGRPDEGLAAIARRTQRDS
jgi:hypothetical protein